MRGRERESKSLLFLLVNRVASQIKKGGKSSPAGIYSISDYVRDYIIITERPGQTVLGFILQCDEKRKCMTLAWRKLAALWSRNEFNEHEDWRRPWDCCFPSGTTQKIFCWLWMDWYAVFEQFLHQLHTEPRKGLGDEKQKFDGRENFAFSFLSASS